MLGIYNKMLYIKETVKMSKIDPYNWDDVREDRKREKRRKKRVQRKQNNKKRRKDKNDKRFKK